MDLVSLAYHIGIGHTVLVLICVDIRCTAVHFHGGN